MKSLPSIKKLTTKTKKECFICYNNNKQKLFLLSSLLNKINCKCDNYIHKRCLQKWIAVKRTCPVCNSYIDNNRDKDDTYTQPVNPYYHATGTMIIRIYNPRIVKYFIYFYEIFILLLASCYIVYILDSYHFI
jgi:hypothetical protein